MSEVENKYINSKQEELRRIQLLEEARSVYGRSSELPPIHPRYKGINKSLSGEEDMSRKHSSLGLRTLIACVLLMVFISADTEHITYKGWSTERISENISKTLDVKTFWKSL